MSTLREKILDYIDSQLDDISRAPLMWGPLISVELQVLQLIEFRSVTVRPDFERQNPRAVLDAYNAFLARKFPGAPPAPLATLLEREGRTDELMQILGEFRIEQVREMSSSFSSGRIPYIDVDVQHGDRTRPPRISCEAA